MAPSVVDDDQQVIDFVWCGSATNASDTLSNSDDSTDDPSCSEAWEEAKNLLPVLQLKLDREDKFVGRFSRVPLSELPILFKVSEKVRKLVSFHLHSLFNFGGRFCAMALHHRRQYHHF